MTGRWMDVAEAKHWGWSIVVPKGTALTNVR
jgi:hypothetical protein